MHFGLSIIEHQKSLGQYGEFLEYDDYQSIKQCETIMEYENWLRRSNYRNAIIFDDAKKTYEYLAAECRIELLEKAQKNTWAFAALSLLDIMYLPFTLFGYMSNKLEMKKLKRIQKRLVKDALVITSMSKL